MRKHIIVCSLLALWSMPPQAQAEELGIYNKKGERIGRVEKNPYGDGYTIRDRQGRRTGRVEVQPYRENGYNLYDRSGRLQGRINAESNRSQRLREKH